MWACGVELYSAWPVRSPSRRPKLFLTYSYLYPLFIREKWPALVGRQYKACSLQPIGFKRDLGSNWISVDVRIEQCSSASETGPCRTAVFYLRAIRSRRLCFELLLRLQVGN